jgi:hypothetical protein
MSLPQAEPPVSKAEIQRLVDDAIRSKIVEFRRLLYAFLAGLGVLLTVLLGDHWWNDGQLLDALRARALAFDLQLSRVLGKTVAFSYANEYWLDNNTAQESLAFYANRAQSVVVLIQVLHQGAGSRVPVTIKLDQRPAALWQSAEDLQWSTIDLTDKLKATGDVSAAGPANVHYLVFAADHSPRNQDRVFVRVLMNVVGLERSE